jgi:hypothetical protein
MESELSEMKTEEKMNLEKLQFIAQIDNRESHSSKNEVSLPRSIHDKAVDWRL